MHLNSTVLSQSQTDIRGRILIIQSRINTLKLFFKKGVRLTYCGQFSIFDGATLERSTTDHEIPNMYAAEDRAFIDAIHTGEKNRNYIDNILESMKLLDTLYASSDAKKEIEL